jgi:uncharacterized protein YbjT (DUF2867 family)
MTILVTGGTGTLGRPTVDLLRAAGHDVRILSRRSGDGRVVGDLSTGAGLTEALAGVDTVLHLATTAGRKDVAQSGWSPPRARRAWRTCSTSRSSASTWCRTRTTGRSTPASS